GELTIAERRISVREALHHERARIEPVVSARVGVARDLDEVVTLVPVLVDDVHALARELLRERLLYLLDARVEEVHVHAVVDVNGGDQAVVLAETLHALEVIARVRVDEPFRAPVLEIEPEQGPAAVLEIVVEQLIRVFAESDRLERVVG